MLTGYGSIASAVEAMRLGAHNYLSKPADADEMLAAVTGDARPGAARRRDAPPPPTLARAEWEHIQRILADCRRQRLRGRAPARHHPPHAAAQAEEVPAAELKAAAADHSG